jgi:hypothetical protein
MAWANLALLGIGGAMLSVPILIHFLMQPKPVEIVFPAMRFLKQKQMINRSRTRLRHILLLLLRCILIGLLVLALAGPAVASQQFGKWLTFGGISFVAAIVGLVLLFSLFSGNANRLLNGILGAFLAVTLLFALWYGLKLFDDDESGLILADDGEPVAVVIVFDCSPTMQYELENETRQKKGTEIAKWIVNQFPSGSQICVAATDGDTPFFSVDGGAANRRIESLKTCFSPTTIPETLADALPLIEDSPLERKEVYIVSNLTRNAWAMPTSDPAINRLAKDKSINLFVVDVGVEEPTDFALGGLDLSARQITSNGSLKIRTSIRRLGAAAQRNVRLSIEKPDDSLPVVRDGKTMVPEKAWTLTKTADVRDNGTEPLSFEFEETLAPGTYHGKIEVQGNDPLSLDDEQYFTFEVNSPWQALVVRPRDVDSSFVEGVLAPMERVRAGNSAFEVTVVDQADFNPETDLEPYQAVFLIDPGPLADESWQQLDAWVSGGGGLSIFLGPAAADRDGLPRPEFQTEAASRILTGSLLNQFQCPDRIKDPFLWSPQNFDHPVLSMFREVSTSIPWSKVPVYTFWGLEPDENGESLPTQVVLNYNNFEPAMIERRIGAGRIIVSTTSISEPSSSNERLPWNQIRSIETYVTYVIVRSISRFIVQADSSSLDVRVGQIASLRNDLKVYPESWQVFSPNLEKPPAKVVTVNGSLSYRFTDTPGHYRFKGKLDGPVLRGFSANIDPATVDLTRVLPAELDKVLGANRYQLAKQQNEITRQQGQARKGREFYPLLMLMMFIAVIIEYLVSNRFYKH